MLKKISPAQVFDMAKSGAIHLVDIRESSEYAETFIPGSRLAPLSIAPYYPVKDAESPKKAIVYFCHSGNRTENNADMLEKLADGTEAYQMEGGISGWQKAGLPVQHGVKSFPIARQIQIAAGSLVLIGIVGSTVWHSMYLLSAFVGAGLVFAGITGFCGMGILLQKMPWNR